MMGNGCLGDGEVVAERLVGALERGADGLQHGEPPRIGERLGDALELSGDELDGGSRRIHGHMTIELLVGWQIRDPIKRCPRPDFTWRREPGEHGTARLAYWMTRTRKLRMTRVPRIERQ